MSGTVLLGIQRWSIFYSGGYVTLDADTITAATGVLTALIAISAVWVEGRRSRLTRQADLLIKFDERFYSVDMLALRTKAGRKYAEGDMEGYEIEEILDYFSMLAALFERGAIDHALAYEMYHYCMIRYWHAAAPNISRARTHNAEAWRGLERVVDVMSRRERKVGVPAVTPQEVKRFMLEEGYQSPRVQLAEARWADLQAMVARHRTDL